MAPLWVDRLARATVQETGVHNAIRNGPTLGELAAQQGTTDPHHYPPIRLHTRQANRHPIQHPYAIPPQPQSHEEALVAEIVSDHHVVAAGETDSWCLLVESTEDGRSRLISRWRQDWPRSVGASIWIALADPGAFIMEQRMLRRIRDLAESRSAEERLASSGRPV